MRTLLVGCLVAALVAGCAPTRFLSRPQGTLPAGHAWLAGRAVLSGFEHETWQDPFGTGLGAPFLFVTFVDGHGARLLAPCRGDGVFACKVPLGRLRLDHFLVATRYGALVTAVPDRKLAVVVRPGATDLGRLCWQVRAPADPSWRKALNADWVMVRRVTSVGRTTFEADDGPRQVLAEATQNQAIPLLTDERASRAQLYRRLDAMLERCGL